MENTTINVDDQGVATKSVPVSIDTLIAELTAQQTIITNAQTQVDVLTTAITEIGNATNVPDDVVAKIQDKVPALSGRIKSQVS